jgi:hypothetical protein
MEVEFEEAMQRHEDGIGVCVPVILRHCLWKSKSFGIEVLGKGPPGGQSEAGVLDKSD